MSDSKERAKEYYDIDGNKVELDTLCRKEPAWAANVIRTFESQLTSLLNKSTTVSAETVSKMVNDYESQLTAAQGEVEKWKKYVDALHIDHNRDKAENSRMFLQLERYSGAVGVECTLGDIGQIIKVADEDSWSKTWQQFAGQRVKVWVKGESE